MEVIVGLVLVVAFVFLIRAFGAWMLRIDDVIYYQKEILKELKSHKINNQNIKNVKNYNIETEMDDELKNVIKSANPFKK
jgi:uncharacterized membrane protein